MHPTLTRLRSRRPLIGLLGGAAVVSAIVAPGVAPTAAASSYGSACFAQGTARDYFDSSHTTWIDVPATQVRYGSRGVCVQYAQWLLQAHGYSVGSYGTDGAFGPATLGAVRAFQAARPETGPVDGIVGPRTWGALIPLG